MRRRQNYQLPLFTLPSISALMAFWFLPALVSIHPVIVGVISEVCIVVHPEFLLMEPYKQEPLCLHLGKHVHQILGEELPCPMQLTDWISNHELVGIEIHAGDLSVGMKELSMIPIITPW